MTPDCPRAGKWIRGCRFEARHEYGRPDKMEFGWSVRTDEAEQLLRATRPWTYVRDVCRTCGRTIERSAGRQALAAVEETKDGA